MNPAQRGVKSVNPAQRGLKWVKPAQRGVKWVNPANRGWNEWTLHNRGWNEWTLHNRGWNEWTLHNRGWNEWTLHKGERERNALGHRRKVKPVARKTMWFIVSVVLWWHVFKPGIVTHPRTTLLYTVIFRQRTVSGIVVINAPTAFVDFFRSYCKPITLRKINLNRRLCKLQTKQIEKILFSGKELSYFSQSAQDRFNKTRTELHTANSYSLEQQPRPTYLQLNTSATWTRKNRCFSFHSCFREKLIPPLFKFGDRCCLRTSVQVFFATSYFFQTFSENRTVTGLGGANPSIVSMVHVMHQNRGKLMKS